MAGENLIMKLEKQQNGALRTILGVPRWPRVLTMLQETGLLSISNRLKLLQVGFSIEIKSYKSCQLQTECIMHIQSEGDTSRTCSFSSRTIIALETHPTKEAVR